MEKIITYFGIKAKIVCDQKCNKAWGINSRPKLEFDENEPEDYAFLADDELGKAPEDPGTYECNCGKPTDKNQIPNKWCVRECERSAISKPYESHLPLELPDFSKRFYNLPRKHGQ